MADIVSELASKCGISMDMARKGLGVILELLKSKLPAATFEKISGAIPGSDQMMASAAESTEGGGGGVLDAVKGALGKVFGGEGGVGAVLAKLGQTGMSPDQIQGFLTNAPECLKDKLPESVKKQLAELLPAPQEAGH
jgi:hypothetical protein